MPVRQWKLRILHIIESIERIQQFVEGMSLDQLRGDTKTMLAIVSSFVVIGEATVHIPAEVKRAHPRIPWSLMKRMRNVLIHEYDRIDLEVVWDTINDDFPTVLPELRAILSESPDDR
ncbi:MAG: DUF86 domain-containing protein [Candidatus Hydrogenedentota bacterium]